MDEARALLDRLERIRSLDRSGTGPHALLVELRALLQEAEEWAGVEGGEAGERAVARLREALARDMIAV